MFEFRETNLHDELKCLPRLADLRQNIPLQAMVSLETFITRRNFD
jgi:hypothetical protein